jgi:hypothetical protein
MYPKVNAKLREEILEHVGPSRRPTYDDIRDMKYLRAVINGRLSAVLLRNAFLTLLRDHAALPLRVSPSVSIRTRLNSPTALSMSGNTPHADLMMWFSSFVCRECINATTWPSPNPNEKPIYIPAGTQYVPSLHNLTWTENLHF